MTLEHNKQFTTGGVFQCTKSSDLAVVFANSNFYSFIGLSEETFLILHDNKLKNLSSPDNSPEIFDYIETQLQLSQGFSVELKLVVADGLQKWMWMNAEVMVSDSGEESLYCIFSDISLQKTESEQLKTLEQRYLFVLDHIEDIIFEWDYKTKEMYQMIGRNTTFSCKPTVKKFPDDIATGSKNLHPDDKEIFLNNYRRYDNGETSAYAEYRIRNKSGIYSWCSTVSVGIFENGELVKVMGKISNINDQKLQLLELSRKAMRDPLTELYNRKATESLVAQYIDSTKNMAAMMIIDLDNFKLVNDTFGHLQGDNVLNEVAAEIKRSFRSTDIVGRVGGDEFVVFMTDINSENSVCQIADNILVQFKKSLEGLSVGCNLSGSIGISIYPKDANTYSELLDRADVALYSAKNTGKNKYVMYDDTLSRVGFDGLHTPHERIKRTPNESQKKEELYRIVLEKSKINAWVYDIKQKRIHKILTSSTTGKATISYENFPQDMIDKGYIHPHSIQPLLDIYLRLAMGEQDVTGEICTLNDKDKSWDWQLISYTSIYDDDGMPDIAIGTSVNITDKKNAQVRCKQEAELFTVLESGRVCASITNLTQNIVERYRHMENPDISETDMSCYEDVMRAECAFIANLDDIKRYTSITREYLMDIFAKGESHLFVELRRTTKDGQLAWVSVSFSLLKDAQTGDIYVYYIMRDINAQKRQELSLTIRAKVDELTGAYEQQTAQELIDKNIQLSRKEGTRFALINFSIDGYSKIAEYDGENLAQTIMLELSRLVQYNLTNYIFGRFFGSQLLILVRSAPAREKLVALVDNIQRDIQNIPTFKNASLPVTVCAGIVFDNDFTVDFNSTYRCAELALDLAKKSGTSSYIIYENQTKPSFCDTSFSGLYKGSNNAIVRCALALSEFGDRTKGITSILNELGLHYDATKIFIADYSPCADYTGGIYIWSGAVSTVTRQAEQYDIEALCPHVFRCLEQNAIFAIKDISILKNSYPTDYQCLKDMGVQSFLAAAIRSSKDIIGYISVINPKSNDDDTSFFITLHKLLSSEMEKYRLLEKRKFLSLHDSLTSLWNRNKFSEYSSALKEEGLISLGVISVDINGLKHLNSQNGHKAGDRAVVDTAHAILEVFNDYDCYRFSGDEFLILCENISKEAFFEKIMVLKSRYAEFASFSVSIGYSWSDVDIRLDDLVRHSDEKMMSEKQEYYLISERKTRNYNPIERTKLLEDIKSNYYVMFLQPKISAETGEVSGAEALVRFIDAANVITYPDKFVPRYEANGLIKYIDLLMMDSVCKTLRNWIDLGKTPVCISLNLSRATILAGNIVSEMCRISDLYNTPRHLVEVEITESFGDLEREAITGIGKQITTAGFRLSLDDFGSKYSNLSILSAASWDTLKIDKSLVNDIFSNNNTQIILKKLFETCRALGISAVSEGVETKEQYQILASMGCDDVQGYYFNKPMPLKAFESEYIK